MWGCGCPHAAAKLGKKGREREREREKLREEWALPQPKGEEIIKSTEMSLILNLYFKYFN